MKNKNVIYTAIFGDYEGLIPQPKMAGFDYICFTDNKHFKSNIWDIRVTEPFVPGDPVRSSRYIKINAHLFLKEYETSIFIDGNYLIIGDLNNLIAKRLKDCPMECFAHNRFKGNERNSIREEFKAVTAAAKTRKRLRKEIPLMKKQMAFYDEVKFPDNYGLIHSAVLLRKHNNLEVIHVMEDWWQMVKQFSRRDQLSFNYAAWKNNFKYGIMEGSSLRDNGFFYRVGAHRKNWKKKIFKTNVKKFFGLIR